MTPLIEKGTPEEELQQTDKLCWKIEGLHLSELQEAVVGYTAESILREVSSPVSPNALTKSASMLHAPLRSILQEQPVDPSKLVEEPSRLLWCVCGGGGGPQGDREIRQPSAAWTSAGNYRRSLEILHL